MKKLSVLVPVFNERDTIEEILRRIEQVEIQKEILVVDDGSRDGTKEKLESLAARPAECRPDLNQIRIFFHKKNQGKGVAVRTALQQATGDVFLIQDADLEYNPRDYPLLLEPICDGRADVVYGSRFLGAPHRALFYWHYAANRTFTFLSNILTNLNLSDIETCYKVFTRDVAERISLRSKRFGFDPEITAQFARLGCRIYEVPVSYSGRTYAEGKKIRWKDGLTVLWAILRYNLF